MPHELNWTPAEGWTDVNHSAHRLDVSGNLPSNMLDEIKWRLANFFDFNGGHNQVALVCTTWETGVRYAWFDMSGPAGFMSRFVNGRQVAVRLWCDIVGIVFGDTVERHMLIGQRRWSVQSTGADSLRIVTEAHERPRGKLNRLGLRLIGKVAQLEVWNAYLQNMDAQLTRDFGSRGTVTASAVQTVRGNPWSPQDPYPLHGGNC